MRHTSIKKRLLTTGLSLGFMLTGICAIFILYLEAQLPNVDILKQVQLQVPLRIYTADRQLIAEYGEKKRLPIAINHVPKQLINAILSTEDQRFYEHSGVDIFGLFRAAKELIATGRKEQGGSTITMQVARNFFLSRRKTFLRKIKEILLAIKIDHQLDKDKILELYLNKIYFGHRAYGVAAAAQVYYGKTLQELTLPETAMLAGLPKAPSSMNPLTNSSRAKKRRNHVLDRMLEQDKISQSTHFKATHTALSAAFHSQPIKVDAPYVAEMVRQTLITQFGKKAYTLGLQVTTTLNSKLQIAADKAARDALLNYDKRHGYRGVTAHWGHLLQTPNFASWLSQLQDLRTLPHLQPAAVIGIEKKSALVLLANGNIHTIPWRGLYWARADDGDTALGPYPKKASDILQAGDLIWIEKEKSYWSLAQAPAAEAALIALNPHDGAILALVGGYNYNKSHFNRATQAQRQPGSGFKPFVYTAALAKGLTLASIINDAPVVKNDSGANALWRPQNDTRKFYGPTRLRVGLARSRNLVSIRLLEQIGVPYTLGYLKNFGFTSAQLPNSLSLALGTAEVSPLELASGYAIFANGGFQVTPYFIKTIDDDLGHTIYQAEPELACATPEECQGKPAAKQVISSQLAYLMDVALRGVIQHGTGRAARVLKRNDLAGKTGTTNDQVDAWFTGYNPHIITTSWIGFDKPHTLGEYGAQAALPMWISFMREALAGIPVEKHTRPPGLVTVRIDPKTGLLAASDQSGTIFETFRQAYLPATSDSQTVADNEPEQSEEAAHLF